MKKLMLVLMGVLVIFNSCEKVASPVSEGGYDDSVAEVEVVSEMSDSSEWTEEDVPLSSSAATYQDPKRKFVRKADVSFEVENVYKTTLNLEKKVIEIGGFVTESTLRNNVYKTQIIPKNEDSATQVRKSQLEGIMTFRIPQLEMNSFLLSLSEELVFLNHRTITADDVSSNLALAKLEKERLNATKNDLNTLTNQNGKIVDKQDIINSVNNVKSDINQQKIQTQRLNDEIELATITIAITEHEKIIKTIVPNTSEVRFRKDFLYSVKQSLQTGFYVGQDVFLLLLKLWPLLLLALTVIFIVRFFKTKKL